MKVLSKQDLIPFMVRPWEPKTWQDFDLIKRFTKYVPEDVQAVFDAAVQKNKAKLSEWQQMFDNSPL